jgi:HEAT repeat protein
MQPGAGAARYDPPVIAILFLLLRQDPLDELLRRLDSPEIAEREEAVRKLMDRSLDELAMLEKAYAGTGDPERRARLRRALAGVRRKSHAELLRELERAPDRADREAGEALAKADARGALGALKNRWSAFVERAVHALLDLFREDEEIVRAALCEHHASWPPDFDARAVPYVSGSDVDACRGALWALGRARRPLRGVDGRTVADAVTRIVADEIHPCRLTALQVIPALGDERSVEAVVASLRGSAEVQALGLAALRGFLERRPALSGHARAAEPLLGSVEDEVRRLAYEAIALHPRADADLPRVREALKRELPKVRWGVLELVATLRDPSLAGDVAGILPEQDGAKAAEVLFRLGPACAAEHLPACFERQPGMTKLWLDYLAERGDSATLEPLGRGLAGVVGRGTPKSREAAFRLAEPLDVWFDAEAVAASARTEDDWDRRRVFERVSSAKTPAGVEVLRAGLRDKEAGVRREAVRAAGRSKACRDEVLEALATDKDVRDEAIEALGLLGDRGAVPRLLPLVRTNRKAREAMALLGTPEDAGPLIEIAREEVEGRHEIAVLAAGLLGERAVAAFRPLMDDRRLRAASLEVLAARGAVECAPEALKHLSDSDPRAVRAAAGLVGRAGLAEAVPRLLDLLRETDVREAAAGALARMPRERVASSVAPFLKSREASLRATAAGILLALDADELAPAAKELLGDDSAAVALHGVALVRRRKMKEHAVELELLSRRREEKLRREALEALAELDWTGAREKLLARLEGAVPEIGPLFGLRNDDAALPILLRRASEEGDGGYEALVALNSYRKPSAFGRAAAPSFRGIGTVFGDSLEQKARRLSREAGVELRVEVPPPPPPRASYQAAFDSSTFHSSVPFKGGGGGRYSGGGEYSLLQKIRVGLGAQVVPLVEDDGIRLLRREGAVRFWKDWAAARTRK